MSSYHGLKIITTIACLLALWANPKYHLSKSYDQTLLAVEVLVKVWTLKYSFKGQGESKPPLTSEQVHRKVQFQCPDLQIEQSKKAEKRVLLFNSLKPVDREEPQEQKDKFGCGSAMAGSQASQAAH